MTGQFARLTVLIDDESRWLFDELCAQADTNASAQLRLLIAQFVADASRGADTDYTSVIMARTLSAEAPRTRLTILLEPALKEALEHACADSDMTVSQVVRRLINAWVDKHQERPARGKSARKTTRGVQKN